MEIKGDLLLKLLGLELTSTKRREPQSGDDFEEVGYILDFRGESSDVSQKAGRWEACVAILEGSDFDHYNE